MDCRDCPRYDPEHRTCRDGKVNPARYETAVQVAGVMGLRALCPLNDHRERVVANRGRTLGAAVRPGRARPTS